MIITPLAVIIAIETAPDALIAIAIPDALAILIAPLALTLPLKASLLTATYPEALTDI
jgi:hypothetical protein